MENIVVKIGNVSIGRGLPIVIQTMCNCDTNDIDTATKQCIELSNGGADLIRLTTQGLKEVNSLSLIKRRLLESGVETPLVADVHFSPEVAIASAKVADKVRINPGNFAQDHSMAKEKFSQFLKVCKEYNTAIRIGINHGSLGKRITELYGNTSTGMKEAMVEWVKMCLEENFRSIVLSLKASSVPVMIDAYRQLNKWMVDSNTIFPLHLGVTEAGNGDIGRIKSAVGLASLLHDGIGDTIRVSLTEPPINELPVAKFIANYFNNDENRGLKSAIPPHFDFNTSSYEDFILEASCVIGPLLINKTIDDFSVSCVCQGKQILDTVLEGFKDDILQATKRRITKCEYIACPSCGRTLYDIEKTFNEVKARTSHLKGITIAVMGCIVNGPGEMADADYGYIGEGRGKVSIYKGKEAVLRSVPQEKAIDALLEIIAKNSK